MGAAAKSCECIEKPEGKNEIELKKEEGSK
jgi:hypothetical protein